MEPRKYKVNKRSRLTKNGAPRRVADRSKLRPHKTGTNRWNGVYADGIDQTVYAHLVPEERFGFILTTSYGRPVNLNTKIGERFRQKLAGHVADKGGEQNITTAELDLIMSASILGVILEQEAANFLGGDKFDKEIFASLSVRHSRLLKLLGLKRKRRKINPRHLDEGVKYDVLEDAN